MKRLIIAGIVLLPVVLWGAAPGEQLSYSGDLEELVVKRCGDCHSTKEPKANLVLVKGEGYGNLVARPSVQVPEAQLVVTGNLEASYLWKKLMGETEIGKGMPRTMFGSKRLPEKELDLFRRWIEDGAKP
ncbi:MAG: hypothetical protein KAJ78_04720 [Acidobacteria bacterium]|nr:hypothetical protein [Acidobacteriota bacterium]